MRVDIRLCLHQVLCYSEIWERKGMEFHRVKDGKDRLSQHPLPMSTEILDYPDVKIETLRGYFHVFKR